LSLIAAALQRLQDSKSSDMLATVDLDIAFHQTVIAATNNRFMVGTYQTWLPQILFSCSLSANLSQSRSEQRQQQIVHGHDRILSAIVRQDSDGASAAMVAHLQAVRLTVFTGRFVETAAGEPQRPYEARMGHLTSAKYPA
jgi:DNA-binding GntR family transcriptional regulator